MKQSLCPDKSLYTLLTARMLTLSSASISGYFLFLISQMSPPQPLSPVNKTLFITTPAPNPVPNVIPIKFLYSLLQPAKDNSLFIIGNAPDKASP